MRRNSTRRNGHLPHPGKVRINRAKRKNKLATKVTLDGVEYPMPEITLQWLRDRTERDGEHWIWQGYIQKHGSPQCRMALAPHKHKTILVRRLVWANANPEDVLPEGVYVTNKCRVYGCVAPSCIEHADMSALMKSVRPELPLSHKANLAASRRSKSRISDEAVNDMRYSGKPVKELCEEYGVRKEYVNQVRAGTLRRDYRPNMFMQLIAKENKNASAR